ncbi:MAG: LPS export ABC transporter periplasmic protein LptC [Calditrichaeota bacterium]|nr:MAG: LPS export ABC transporter periplasmic protein LptC [Calditrichota bacterium]MBL1204379.1 LPS export ABC transporter periplasmic protein LptC [Calditrichota bacterium]NOG44208.1 LPS export ABC transporter periplasmic protein LptC [Calditrichota bacterium]
MIKLIFIIILLFTLFNCAQREEETTGSSTVTEFPDQESWNSTLFITNDGQKVGIVEAKHFQKFSKKKKTYISEGLKVDFFNNEGQHTSVLTSIGGEVDDQKQDMIAYGNVIVVSDSGMTLYTDTLMWDNKRQKIISLIPVKITSDTDTLYGDSFISDPSLENYEITNSHGTGSELIGKPQ